jgi:hypothetical protein
VNTYLRGLKAYIRWLLAEGQVKDVFKVQFLKTERKILATLTPEQVRIRWNCRSAAVQMEG